MSLWQAILTLAASLISAAGGVLVGRAQLKRDHEKEVNSAVAVITQARITDEAIRRKEIDETSRDIRNYLRVQVSDLNKALEQIEITREREQEKWHQILGDLSTKNLDLELQQRKHVAHIDQLLEEAKVIDDEVKILKTHAMTCQTEASVMSARLNQCRAEVERLLNEAAAIKKIERKGDDYGE